MSIYEITGPQGEVINTIVSDAEFIKQYENYRLVAEDSKPASTPIRKLTKLEYMNRFTDAELAGIYTAAKSVIQVEIWLEKFKLATEIDLDDPRTVGGLQAMEASGLLDAGRAVEILA